MFEKFVVLFLVIFPVAFSERRVLCYYGSWAIYRPSDGLFSVQNLDPFICTHVVYTFAGLNLDGTVKVLDAYLELADDWGKDNYGLFNNLKNINPSLKTIIAIGGWNEGSEKYSIVANNRTLRTTFVKNVTQFVLKYGFDGLDMDWEYPNRRDSAHGSSDIKAFTQMLKELRQSFDEHGLLLSSAVSSVKDMAVQSYEIPEIIEYMDFINIMTYDLHGAWDSVTGHNAALHQGEGEDVESIDAYTVENAIEFWLSRGSPPEKINLGLALYGRTFSLVNPLVNTPGSPTNGAGLAGQYTQTPGNIGYNELCVLFQSQPWEKRYDSKAKVPYAFLNRDWVTYDDADSLAIKVQYALAKGLGGVMVWSIETDDFRGKCHTENFHLLRTINHQLGREVPTTSEGPASSSATTSSTTPSSSHTSSSTSESSSITTDICFEEGFIANPENCSEFYSCAANPDGSWKAWKFECPGDLLWDNISKVCNYPNLVNC